ncbi:sensor histidine kinase KdpD [Rhodonellum sp.]|uniref:sensor histidine kinase n=1 Tax=Rhodonellum sp. TaxID=2231180 RepID=UPI00271D4E61|nr:HAMP domain-containing sensor histidine kinase [Rhodonellum sp.]MDO9554790.1 HAMP domain-containing sensor histidine kinase [Rhodonellum sp.]
MNIRKKIIWNFSVVTIVLVGITLVFIYMLFYDYRKEEFQQQQQDKILTTLNFLTEIREIDEKLIGTMDRISIDEYYNEKILIFDANQKLIHSSIQQSQITFTQNILNELAQEVDKVELKEGEFEILGIKVESKGLVYYGISKAHDLAGFHYLDYLRFIFSLTFMAISVIIILMSHYLSKKITDPIVSLTKQIKDFNFEVKFNPIVTTGSKNEVAIMGQRFNELMQRMNEAFSFQKNAVQHISHELKTPIAVLVSNFERIEQESDLEKIKYLIKNQKEDTENLSKIINSLMEISKTESGSIPKLTKIRVDELIFDLAEEFGVLHPEFHFSIEYAETIEDEQKLTVPANLRLLKAALSNLMINCIQYSDDYKAKINIIPRAKLLQLEFINKGPVINEDEKKYIYEHYFRGKNSQGKRGFGLGLVFIRKILRMHQGEVVYSNEDLISNKFTITLPLS